MTNLERIERSQKRLFRSIQHDLVVLEQNKSRELLSYEKNYKSLFKNKFLHSTREELIKAVLKSEFILVADFHPFSQSQKTFLRILRDVQERNPEIVIALECAQTKYQRHIDYYLDGKITLEELREEIHFAEYWPFSWKSYGELFNYAKFNKIPVFALNISNDSAPAASLFERDQAAAKIIVKARQLWPAKRIFVLYGELHLAPKHLPLEIKKQGGNRTLTIFQNEPSLYWKVAKQVNSQKLEVLKFSKQQYCIMNAVPWIKLLSYLDWLEGNLEADDFENQDLDIMEAIQKHSSHLCEAMAIPAPNLLEFDLQNSESVPYLQSQIQKKQFSPAESKALSHAILLQRLLVLPARRLLFLPNVSSNALSEAAALILHYSLARKKLECVLPSENMSSLILQNCIGYLGAKILNPKRKCNEEADIQSFLKNKSKFKNTRADLFRQRAFQWATKELDWIFKRRNSRFSPTEKFQSMHGFEAARIVGYILADRLFTALQRDPALLKFAVDLFSTQRVDKKDDDKKVKELAAHLPKRGQSKHQKL